MSLFFSINDEESRYTHICLLKVNWTTIEEARERIFSVSPYSVVGKKMNFRSIRRRTLLSLSRNRKDVMSYYMHHNAQERNGNRQCVVISSSKGKRD